jgi:cyclopropane fatty-acyl-phospholipid synthase-like methyltransferase
MGEALDLGSGEGRNSLLLAHYGYHVHAVDSSSQGIQKLEKYAHSRGLNNIDGEVADVRTVQLTTNFYDAIVAVTILDHIPKEEGKKAAEALIDALKPGVFVFIEAFTWRRISQDLGQLQSILAFYTGQQPSQIFFRLLARLAPFKEVVEAHMLGFKRRSPVVLLVSVICFSLQQR